MSKPTSSTLSNDSGRGVELSALQASWLAEIGLEKRILAHYVPAMAPFRAPEIATSQGQPQAHKGALAPTDPEHSAATPQARSQMQGGPSRPMTEPATTSGSDLAMAALKQAGGRRRTAPAGIGGADALQPASEHLSRVRASTSEHLPTDWQALQAHAEACQACNLHAQRDQLVFGAGDTDKPEWLIVGEAPGKADDRSGLPFQGKAGKLLHGMLVAAGVHSASLVLGGQPQVLPPWSQPARMYFANLIKCRPLGNRTPAAAEVRACMPYLLQQIELLQPKRILALGRLAAQALLQVEEDVENLRGRIYHLSTAAGTQIPVVVTWHPAVLLMHPQNKGQAWADLNLIKRL